MDGPVILGISWCSRFDTPAADGTVSIAADAYVRGGQEMLARIMNNGAQMIGFNQLIGEPLRGSRQLRMSYATLEQLLAENGDCTAPDPLKAPAPPSLSPGAAAAGSAAEA